ncbi:MAG: SlyX family protein [Opitutaceae bacterium]|nr:SlyX family protein [Opitutaceae bacterium]
MDKQESNLTQLEIKLTFLEEHVEEQDRVIHQLCKKIEKLGDQLNQSQMALSDFIASQSAPPSEKPPHY